MKIGVLDVNNDTSSFMDCKARDGILLQSVLQNKQPCWDIDVYYLWQQQYITNIDAYDGYVISGSPASVNDSEQWIIWLLGFIRQLHSKQKKTIGICFGHQAIAKALGSTVSLSKNGWSIGLKTLHFNKHYPWMTPNHQNLKIYAFHQEQITNKSDYIDCVASNDSCSIGSFVVGKHFFSIAYHPEYSQKFMEECCDVYSHFFANQAALDKARLSLQEQTNADHFIDWMMAFLSYRE